MVTAINAVVGTAAMDSFEDTFDEITVVEGLSALENEITLIEGLPTLADEIIESLLKCKSHKDFIISLIRDCSDNGIDVKVSQTYEQQDEDSKYVIFEDSAGALIKAKGNQITVYIHDLNLSRDEFIDILKQLSGFCSTDDLSKFIDLVTELISNFSKQPAKPRAELDHEEPYKVGHCEVYVNNKNKVFIVEGDTKRYSIVEALDYLRNETNKEFKGIVSPTFIMDRDYHTIVRCTDGRLGLRFHNDGIWFAVLPNDNSEAKRRRRITEISERDAVRRAETDERMREALASTLPLE